MLGVAGKQAILDRYNELMMDYSDETADEAAKLQDQIDSPRICGISTPRSRWPWTRSVARLRTRPSTSSRAARGAAWRCAVCSSTSPTCLLLDEPTNHLDAETTATGSKSTCREYPGAVLIITHDRYFLDNVTGWILELDRGRGIPLRGQLHRLSRTEIQALCPGAARGRGTSEGSRTRKGMARHESPQARQSKSKARIRAYDELVKVNEDRTKSPRSAQIIIPPGERLGQNVITVEGISKGFGDHLLIDDLSFKLPPGGIVGIIGPNGAGKTTLFRMLTGQEQPDNGHHRPTADNVHLGYVDQSRDDLDPNKTVYEEISGGNEVFYLGKREMNARAYTSAFNFRGGDQQQKVGSLSGGQRNRVHLAKMLKSGANVLLLDEPTNDLDTETLAALEEALEEFAGCAVIISPRPHVSRPPRHPHARLRGRQPCRMVRGQFRGLRKGQDQAAGRGLR